MSEKTYVNATTFAVSCLPPAHRGRRHLTVTVELRNPAEDLWAVCANGGVYAADGTWDYEAPPSHRYAAWIAQHRFPFDGALDLARRIAPTMTVNGYTVEFALTHPDWA